MSAFKASMNKVEEEKEVLPFDEFQVNDIVEHPTWGIGSILQRSGRGEHTKLLVTFPDLDGTGQKKLKAAFAKLKKIEGSKDREEEEAAAAEAEAMKAKAAAAEAEEEEEDDEDEENDEILDEKAAKEALNIEDDEEEVAKQEVVKDDDWEDKEE